MNGNGIAQQALIFKGCRWIYFSNFSAPTNSESGRSEERVMKWHILLGDQTMQMYGNGPGNFEGFPYNRALFGLAK